jgi:hypothetical protein
MSLFPNEIPPHERLLLAQRFCRQPKSELSGRRKLPTADAAARSLTLEKLAQ